MIIGLQEVIVRVVLQALRAENGRIDPVRELQEKTLAGFRKYDFVVPDAREKRNGAEGRDLAVDIVLPRDG